jgi:polyphosphate kinase
VGQLNLHERFIYLIDKEIENARNGLMAHIIIKLNNLEEEVLINRLYEASNADVIIQLLVRGICRLVTGLNNQSENISIIRIVNRFLEHGCIFIFCNSNEELIFMDSTDWINRNIYRRIEVCFPVFYSVIKTVLLDMIQLQLNDNVQAVKISKTMKNISIKEDAKAAPIRSQEAIYEYLKHSN